MNNFQNSELFVSMLKRIYFLYLMSLRYFSRLFIATQNLTLITNVQQYDCMYYDGCGWATLLLYQTKNKF